MKHITFIIQRDFSAALRGSNECIEGPEQWCQDLQTAKKCNVVSHCLRIWKMQSNSLTSSSETCLVCKIVIQGIKTMVENKRTQEEIKELAEKVCDLMKNERTAYEVVSYKILVKDFEKLSF